VFRLPVLNPRTRLVNFRVSEDEFQRLKETCARSGARSVSDFARAAVLTEAAAGPSFPILELSHRWNRLEERLDAYFSLVPGIEFTAGAPEAGNGDDERLESAEEKLLTHG
jgi:hypothetical protein